MANEAGQGCADRSSAVGGYTFVSKGGPASATGSCNKLECYANPTNAANEFHFNFFTASVNNLTPIGAAIDIAAGGTGEGCYSFIGGVDFTVFNVNSGEYLGCWHTNNQDYAFTGGSDLWYESGDNTETDNHLYNFDEFGIDGLSADIAAAGGNAPTGVLYGPLVGPFGGPAGN